MVMRAFRHYLNPIQVFDLANGGPREGLQLFQEVPDARIVCCGGDGTAGWVMAEMDKLGMRSASAVAVLPLGTGNDLARCLGWGGGACLLDYVCTAFVLVHF